MESGDPKLREIWSQKTVPVVYRQEGKQPLLVRLPYHQDNWLWLKGDHRGDAGWHGKFKCWELPKSWFEDIARRALERFGQVYVIQPFKEQQKCAPACWKAIGIKCECSCMGENHGSGDPPGKWHVVSETCAVHWGPRQYACRLIRPTGATPISPTAP